MTLQIRAGVVAVLVAAGLSLTWMKAPEVAAEAGQKMCTAAIGNAFAQTIAVPSAWTILDCSEWVMTAAGMSPNPKMRVRLGCVFPDGLPTKFSWSDPSDGFMPVCRKTPLPGQVLAAEMLRVENQIVTYRKEIAVGQTDRTSAVALGHKSRPIDTRSGGLARGHRRPRRST